MKFVASDFLENSEMVAIDAPVVTDKAVNADADTAQPGAMMFYTALVCDAMRVQGGIAVADLCPDDIRTIIQCFHDARNQDYCASVILSARKQPEYWRRRWLNTLNTPPEAG
jgi:hypothetical protein